MSHHILHIIVHFKATRALRDYDGACAQLQEYDFKVQANVRTPLPSHTGMIIDFYEIKAALEAVTHAWKNQTLNHIAPFDTLNPTNENLAQYCFEQLKQALQHPDVLLENVSLWENTEAGVTYYDV